MFNKICFLCGGISDNPYPLCSRCQPTPLLVGSVCEICGLPVSRFVACCGSCLASKVSFEYNYSLFFYRGVAKEVLTQYKFKKDYSFATFYSRCITRFIKERFSNPVVCPVPTSFIKRKLKNGYQLDPIVKELKRCGLDVRFLLKKRFSKTQKKLTKSERESNLIYSFLPVKNMPKDSIIVLIDDVFTTGATINACAKVLKKMNNTIYSITLCRD